MGAVNLERVRVSSYGAPAGDAQQLNFLESWLELSLEYSLVDQEDSGAVIPWVVPKDGREILHAHAREAAQQVAEAGPQAGETVFGRGLKEIKRIWDLSVALWGNLEEQEIAGEKRN